MLEERKDWNIKKTNWADNKFVLSKVVAVPGAPLGVK